MSVPPILPAPPYFVPDKPHISCEQCEKLKDIESLLQQHAERMAVRKAELEQKRREIEAKCPKSNYQSPVKISCPPGYPKWNPDRPYWM